MTELKNLNPQNLAEQPFTAKLLEIGLFGAHSGQVLQARNVFEGLLQAAPELTTPKTGLAFCHLVINEFEAAEKGFRQVLATRPDDVEAQALLALTLGLTGRVGEAEPLLAKLRGGAGPVAELAKQLASSL
ncbi:MAG: tetratricopeptide repeat protein [Deltaproteobacteria bacterium]|nr:tetratricopeptide repeat protein [Deltaproteobacteria bacterium]